MLDAALIDLVFSAFITLLVVIDPIGLAPMFGALTLGGDHAYRRKMAVKGTALAALILIGFALVGDRLLRALGIGLPAFRVAGGILLFFLAIDMVFARDSGLRSTTIREQEEAQHRTDISVFPLAIPLIAGPGALTAMLLFTGSGNGQALALVAVLAVLLVVLLLTLASLLLTGSIMKLIGVTGANVVSRVLGVLLAALAVQFVIDGLRASLVQAG